MLSIRTSLSYNAQIEYDGFRQIKENKEARKENMSAS